MQQIYSFLSSSRVISFWTLSFWLGLSSVWGQQQIEGTVLDADNNSPLAYAQVRTLGITYATLTNAQGKFVLQIPSDVQVDSVQVSFIGYEDRVFTPTALAAQTRPIMMAPKPVVLAEVMIVPLDPRDIIRQAWDAVPDNAVPNAVNMKAFYREMTKENGKYVELVEAALDVYKVPSGEKTAEGNQTRLLRGHRFTSEKIQDSSDVSISLENGLGPSMLLSYPVTGEPYLAHFLRPKHFRLYNYTLTGVSNYQGRDVYIIEIDQAKKLRKKLYKATVYIDVKDMAFASIRYEFSPAGKQFRFTQLGVKAAAAVRLLRLFGVKLDITNELGILDYQFVNGHWQPLYIKKYVSMYVESSGRFDIDLPPKMTLEAGREIVVTQVGQGRGTPIPTGERFEAIKDLEEVMDDYNPTFWQGYNILPPSESLEEIAAEIQQQRK